jgi:transcriptional regulator with XRE-family HTH domain
MDRTALADFLRHRREALKPSDVGLPDGARRRTSGLRREEVAALAGMSTDYYARIEQQRGPQPSDQMLTAITRALRLSLDERDHLFRLAGHNPPRRLRRTDHVSPPLLRVLDRLEDSPAMVLSDLGVTLAQNRLAVALLGDHSRFTGLAASDYYRWFTDPSERARYPVEDRERQGVIRAAGLRAAISIGGPDAQAERMVAALTAESPAFVDAWERHEVAVRFDDHKTIIHPELGSIELDCQALFTEDQSQTLIVLTARPGTAGYDKLQLLGVVGSQEFSEPL